jgi:hypothetical protein
MDDVFTKNLAREKHAVNLVAVDEYIMSSNHARVSQSDFWSDSMESMSDSKESTEE